MKISSAWPSDAQEILLKAALFPPQEAEGYWREFVDKFDLQNMDHGCNQMLPMVYINLNQRLGDNVEKWTCRSVYKYTWANNHFLMHDLKNVLLLLKQHNIKVCLLKGAAYMGHYFPDYGMRVMGDIDLLVSPERIQEMITCLELDGYRFNSIQDDVDAHNLLKLFHARSFVNQRGTDIDVHQYVSKFLGDVKFNERLWKSAKPVELFGEENAAYVLSPSYQLIHTIINGLQYAPESSIRWIVDAVNLLRNHSEEVDWEEVQDICSKYHLNLPVKLALDYLRQELNQPIPDHVISYFKRIKITDRDKKYYEFSSNLGLRYTLIKLKRGWDHYRVYTKKSRARFNPLEFYDFLVVYTNRKSRWALIPYSLRKVQTITGKAIMALARLIFKNGKQIEQ
ncbi:MAG: nucleotidyltransferase family protein [Planctomycetes bacterium]|nr:nucleotidyltransferase family protein [Planctomycetota bacterium]